MTLPNFVEIALFEIVKKYAKFEGRANRPQYWYFVLTQFILNIILNTLAFIPAVGVLFNIIYVLCSLALVVPGLAVAVRRLHDINRSGWWMLILLVPLVGAIILLVFLCQKGTEGDNIYGKEAVTENYKI